MSVMDPLSATLAALATAAQIAIFLFLYRAHREPFFAWWILGWGLRLAYFLIQLGPALGGPPPLWALGAHLATGASNLAFLASGLAFRWPEVVRPGLVLPAAAGALMATALLLSPLGPPGFTPLELAVAESLALVAAAAAFWPSRARRVRGTGLLAGCLLAWALVKLGFVLPLPAHVLPAVFPLSVLLQALQMIAVVVVVLEGARQRVEFLKDFNEKLIDGMGLGLALVGPDLTLRHTNRWMAERFGGELQGRKCLDVYLARAEQCEGCPWRKPALESGQLTVDAPGGRRVLITYSPLTTPEGGTVLLELLNDITEQEAMRVRLLDSERLATIAQMASRVAHEVRNPLGIMSVNAGLLEEDLRPGGSREAALRHITLIKEQIHGVARLIEAYLRTGRLPRPEPEVVDLEAILERQLKTLQDALDRQKITLRRERAGALPALWADPEQLGQVLLNLFRNAMEAMPEGGELRIRTAAGDGCAEVEVSDTGPGVPAEDFERIFTPFYTTKDTGSGLGLAVARLIVQEHGGSLTCLSQGTDGATFIVSLPVREPRA